MVVVGGSISHLHVVKEVRNTKKNKEKKLKSYYCQIHIVIILVISFKIFPPVHTYEYIHIYIFCYISGFM